MARRRAAHAFVDAVQPYGHPSAVTAGWVARRDRLEGALNLNIPLRRHPITALSVLAPLVTSALAAFVPELASTS
ncbi:hypothetical protein [Pedococcus sp. P5_B7]